VSILNQRNARQIRTIIIPVILNIRLIFFVRFWFENSIISDQIVNSKAFLLMNYHLWQNSLTLPKI